MKKLYNRIKESFIQYMRNGMSESTKQRIDHFNTDALIITVIAIVITIVL